MKTMSSNPIIRLYDAVGAGIIVCWESGVVYSNQTGGGACLQPEVEGVFVPLLNEVVGPLMVDGGRDGPVYGRDAGFELLREMNVEKDFLRKREMEREERRGQRGEMNLEEVLMAGCAGPPYGGSGATGGIDEATADWIERVLTRADARLGEVIRIDRSRLRESHEAWVWVSILGDEGSGPAGSGLSLFEGFGPYPRSGVLTWANGD